MNIDKTTSQIEYMKQSWEIESDEKRDKIPGLDQIQGGLDLGFGEDEIGY